MTRLLLRALLMGALILATYGVIWLMPIKPHIVYASILDKHERLAQTASPRIIFVGGSGIALGLDSQLVEHAVGRPVINMGVNAGFGLRYLLDEVKPALRAGDIVVVAPEYEYFYGSSVDGSQNLLWALQVWGSQAWTKFNLSQGQLINIATELPHFMQTRFLELLSFHEDPIYNRDAFNERGDFVNHLSLPSQEIWPTSIDQGKPLNGEVLALLGEFDTYARRQGAQIYLLPPAIAESFYGYEHNATEVGQVIAQVQTKTDLMLLADPSEYVFPVEYFFDTVYHLNAVGREIRSEMIVEDLNSMIK